MQAKKLTRETIREVGVITRAYPDFAIGDCIAVSQRIKERVQESDKKGDKEIEKERLQVFEGDVIAIHNNGASSTFTVRKIGANNVAVERIFPYSTPLIESVAIVCKGDVRRAKLYYIRGRVGKSARIKEKIVTKEQRNAQELAQDSKKSAKAA